MKNWLWRAMTVAFAAAAAGSVACGSSSGCGGGGTNINANSSSTPNASMQCGAGTYLAGTECVALPTAATPAAAPAKVISH